MKFKNWFITEHGDARNLSLAYKIDMGERNGAFKVYATFPICTDKNVADPAFCESSTLKTFDNADDAQSFILDLVDSLNGEDGVPF